MERKTLEALDYGKIQERLQERCASNGAKEWALQWYPSSDQREVERRLAETAEALLLIQNAQAPHFGGLRTIRQSLERAQKKGILTVEEVLAIRSSLEAYQEIRDRFMESQKTPRLTALAAEIEPQPQLLARLEAMFDERGRMRDTASPKLNQLRRTQERLQERVKHSLEAMIQDRTTAKYLQETLVTQRNERYVVPVKAEYKYAVPGIVHDRSATGQTLYIEPLVSVELNNDLQEAALSEHTEIVRLMTVLSEQVARVAQPLMHTEKCTTELDFILARGYLAAEDHGRSAQPATNAEIILEAVRHPLLPQQSAVPITVKIGNGYSILVVTGSNTGGKTVALKTVGLVAAMNQAGLFIPVAGRAVLPIFQNIWVAIGDEQNMAENLSTFSGHMSRLIQIMKDAGSNDLVLLDELGSGTDPVEGAALAIAILEYFHRLGALAMVTTHYSELKQYVYTHPGMENAHVEFDDETLTPTYRLQIGIAGNSQALNITKRLGMLPEVLARAQELKQASAYYEMETVLEELNHKRRELSRMEEDLQTRLAKAEKSHAKWNENNQELQRKKQAILQKARDDARQLKRELKVNAEQIIKDLKRSAKEAKDKQQAVVDEKRQAIDRLSIPNANERTKIPLRKIEIGQAVYVDTLEKVGTVIDIQGKQFKVDLAGLPITVAGRNLFYPLPQEAKPKEIKTKEQIRSKTVAPKMRMAAQSINLIGETVADAEPQVAAFLDAAMLAGLTSVEIIHGKGTGALRKGIHAQLRKIPYVKSFSFAQAVAGGSGVTVVTLG